MLGRSSSSHPRKPFVLVRLLRTLSSFLDLVYARLTSIPSILRRAWSNIKLYNSKRKPEENKAHVQEEKTGKQNKKTPPIVAPLRDELPAGSSRQEHEQANDNGDHPTKIRGFFITPLRVFLWPFKFFDVHHGAVTAVATIVLVVLTFFYVHYSKKQWETMQRQLEDSEAKEAARLVIENFQTTIVPGEFFNVEVKFDVTNAGGTVADDIRERIYFSTINNETGKFNPAPAQPAMPDKQGPSVPPGKSRSYFEHSAHESDEAMAKLMGQMAFKDKNGQPMHFEVRTIANRVLTGKDMYLVNIDVSYTDIFSKKAHITSDCVTYSPFFKEFVSCPYFHQHQ